VIKNKEIHDVDICISGVSLVELNESLSLNYGSIQNKKFIPGNPSARKFQDVLKLFIQDYEIDITNPRSKNYNEVGTFNDDVIYRDFTINTLYYDIQKRLLIDETGKGMSDIQQKIIRTPIQPIITLRQSPIRAFRVFKFLSKFEGFTIHKDLHDCLLLDEVKFLLKTISPEIIKSEFNNIIKGPFSTISFPLFCEYNFLPSVFPLDNNENWNIVNISVNYFQRAVNIIKDNEFIEADRDIFLYSSIFLPFSINYQELPFTKYKMREEWKLSNQIIDNIILLLNSWKIFSDCAQAIFNSREYSTLHLVKILRKLKDKWIILLEFSKLSDSVNSTDDYLQKYLLFHSTIKQKFIDNTPIWKVKPLILAKDLKEKFNLNNKEISDTIDLILEWQVNNPQKSVEDCEGWLKQILNK